MLCYHAIPAHKAFFTDSTCAHCLPRRGKRRRGDASLHLQDIIRTPVIRLVETAAQPNKFPPLILEMKRQNRRRGFL